MISEPELVGGVDFPAPHPADVVAGRDDTPKPPRPPRPWLWAVGGAVLASAVWAGGLYAYERIGPDLGGYRVSRNLCKDAELKAVSAIGKRSEGSPELDEHPALDDASCNFDIEKTEELLYWVSVSYELHKETDPEPEFDALALPPSVYGENVEAERLAGIGERALLLTGEGGLGELHLVVLDGQAVVRIDLSAERLVETEGEGEGVVETTPDPVNISDLRTPVIEDMKALIARLKRPA
ncbi:hypothetical protein ACWCXB_00265 [Streptomyces sp. NPDC001514]